MIQTLQSLPIPEHFDATMANRTDYPGREPGELQEQALAYRRMHGLEPVGLGGQGLHLLVIDAQIDFSFPEGALFVAGRSGTGGMDANLALARFIYNNLAAISQVTCTLDTHLPYQIFFPSAHLNQDDEHPPAHTVVSAEDMRAGRFRPNPVMAAQLGVDVDWLRRQFIHYCEQLEQDGKHQLYLWPYHVLQGSFGHGLAGLVEEARLFHAFARGAVNRPVIKGDHPLSERYSVFSEEVTTCFDGRPLPAAGRNESLIETLLSAEAVAVAGLASSHCVKESVADLLRAVRARDPGLARKIYLLKDCTAAVVVPGGADFTVDAEQAFDEFTAAGMHAVESTTPLSRWPGLS